MGPTPQAPLRAFVCKSPNEWTVPVRKNVKVAVLHRSYKEQKTSVAHTRKPRFFSNRTEFRKGERNATAA